MEISWLGHSCLRIRSNDVTLITDPYGDSLGLSMGRHRADIVTMSHSHPHHSHHEGIEGKPVILSGPGEYEIGGFYITAMGTDRSGEEGRREINTIYSIHSETLTLCHLGDLNQMLSPRQVEELGDTDILFVPSGGVCTVATDRAAELVSIMDPKIVVPMHYRDEGVEVELQPLGPFLRDMGVTEPPRQAQINVTSSTLPRDLQLVVLERRTS